MYEYMMMWVVLIPLIVGIPTGAALVLNHIWIGRAIVAGAIMAWVWICVINYGCVWPANYVDVLFNLTPHSVYEYYSVYQTYTPSVIIIALLETLLLGLYIGNENRSYFFRNLFTLIAALIIGWAIGILVSKLRGETES